jgi:hypothetical protein
MSLKINGLEFGSRTASQAGMTGQTNGNIGERAEQSKYFLLWIAVWVAALAVLIPSLR